MNITNLYNRTLIAFFIFIVFFIGSCAKKEDSSKDDINRLKASGINYGIDYTLAVNTQNVEELILNPNDVEDEKINTYLYQLSLAIEELVEMPSFNQDVINLAVQSPIQTANLISLTSSFPEYKTIIDNKLSTFGTSFDEIVQDFTYDDGDSITTYVPSIFVPNIDIMDETKQPIFSPNIEIDNGEDEALEDYIVVWYYTQSGEKMEVILGEDDADQLTNPIFLLDNSEIDPVSQNLNVLPPDDIDLKSTESRTSFHSHEYRINYRYEKSGKSEFCIVAYRIDPRGTIHWIYQSHGWKQIAKVKKKNIGKDLAKWTSHCENYTPYDQNYVYWNTFERDWNRSLKYLGKGSGNGSTVYLAGNRKYTDEWYQYHPNFVGSNPTDLNYIYWHWAKWHESDKTKFRVWRVNI